MRQLTKEDIKLFGDVQPMQRTDDDFNAYRLRYNEEYLGDMVITEIDEEDGTEYEMEMEPISHDVFIWVVGDSLANALEGVVFEDDARAHIFSIDLAIEGEESDNVVSLTGEKLEKFLKGKTNLKLMTAEEVDVIVDSFYE